MIGTQFGRLTVCGGKERRGRRYFVLCACECGQQKHIEVCKLRAGHTKSCGCLLKDLMRAKQTTHGAYFEPEFRAWSNMKKRCDEARWQEWYGHVKICDRWRESYDNFLADVGRRPSEKHSLDRIDPARDYEPGNVRWATRAAQSRNTKNHKTNTTGVRGVSWSNAKKKWRCAIYVNNRQKHLGYFDDIQHAAAARKRAEDLLWQDER